MGELEAQMPLWFSRKIQFQIHIFFFKLNPFHNVVYNFAKGHSLTVKRLDKNIALSFGDIEPAK